jgi:hypothetical protein
MQPASFCTHVTISQTAEYPYAFGRPFHYVYKMNAKCGGRLHSIVLTRFVIVSARIKICGVEFNFGLRQFNITHT